MRPIVMPFRFIFCSTIKTQSKFWKRLLFSLCYAIMFPGRKSVFRAGCRSDSNRESFKIGPPAGRRPAGGPIVRLCLFESGLNPAQKTDFRPGALLRNIGRISRRRMLGEPGPEPKWLRTDYPSIFRQCWSFCYGFRPFPAG